MANQAGWPRSRQIFRRQRPPVTYFQAGATMMTLAAIIFLVPHVGAVWLIMTPLATVIALLLHSAIATIVLARLDTYPHLHFGMANMITASRAALTAMIGGTVLAGDAHHPSVTMSLFITALAALSLTLDGMDGYLARRSRLTSDYGARFDMEVDALLIFLLAVAVFFQQKAGVWVLLIGSMRYAFLFAQMSIPRLRGTLPDSGRRKTICVMQGISLCLALVPFIPHMLQVSLLATALVLLIYSFMIDIRYLWRKPKQVTEEFAPTLCINNGASCDQAISTNFRYHRSPGQ